MATSSTTTFDSASAIETPRHPWWLTLIEGVVAFIFGAILLWAPAKDKQDAWVMFVTLLGLYWLILGVMDIVRIFQDSTGWGWKLFMGIISFLAGGYILMYPVASAAVLPQVLVLVLGIWGLIYGIMFVFLGFRGAGWGATILGVLTAILGLSLIANYGVAGWGLSMIWTAAVAGVVGGIILVVRAFQERSAA
jgi:uncharacterized membrane protein HdeD (DUF308 family)